MKFSKSLGILIEEALPEWRDKFLSYKDLKKQLKLIYPKDGDNPPNKRPRLADDRTEGGDIAGEGGEGAEVSKEVTDFVKLLENEMEKFNAFFEEKEEEYVIRWKVEFLSLWNRRTCLKIEKLNCCLEFQILYVEFCMVILLQEIKRLCL